MNLAACRLVRRCRGNESIMDYNVFFDRTLDQLRDERRYRVFADFERLAGRLQDRLFRSIAVVEQEEVDRISRRGLTKLMAKLGALSDVARFGESEKYTGAYLSQPHRRQGRAVERSRAERRVSRTGFQRSARPAADRLGSGPPLVAGSLALH
jgi:hypothetical protein